MLLGLDLVISGLRRLLVDPASAPIAKASLAHSVSYHHEGWSEPDLPAWALAYRSVLPALQSNASDAYASFESIWLSGHLHGAVTPDKELDLARPSVLWNDTRCASEAARIAIVGIGNQPIINGMTQPNIERVIELNSSLDPLYQSTFDNYKYLYQILKDAS